MLCGPAPVFTAVQGHLQSGSPTPLGVARPVGSAWCRWYIQTSGAHPLPPPPEDVTNELLHDETCFSGLLCILLDRIWQLYGKAAKSVQDAGPWGLAADSI